MHIVIREAIFPAEREEIYRFRYRIYVEEMRRLQVYADHAGRRIEEPLDFSGHVLGAYEDESLIGTVRFNIGVDDHFGIYTELYRLRCFGPFYPSNVSITTKLMVSPEHRNGRVGLDLAIHSYARALQRGNCFDCIDCNRPLVPFFTRLGYRQLWPEVQHPEYGVVVPMVLVLNDWKHLAKVGSPFACKARFTEDHLKSVQFFNDVLSPAPEVLAQAAAL